MQFNYNEELDQNEESEEDDLNNSLANLTHKILNTT